MPLGPEEVSSDGVKQLLELHSAVNVNNLNEITRIKPRNVIFDINLSLNDSHIVSIQATQSSL